MGMFGPSQWEVQALVTISAQINNIQRKLDALIAATPKVSQEQLTELHEESVRLKAKSDALAQAIEHNRKE